jgi:DNA polymerase III subunit epsilon
MAAAEISALPQDLVFVDLETTGGNAAWHRITEVGVVRVERGELVEQWSSLVNPECRIPSSIEAFTGITNEMVADAPRFAEIAAEVRGKLGGAVFVAHNARFDYSFLRAEFRRLEQNFSAKVLCTVKLSRRLFPQEQRHNLDAIMQRHGLQCAARHRALGDARVLWDLWRKLRAELPEPLRAAAEALLAANALPAHLPLGLADELPEGPGVYRFFGEDDALLYIGKSTGLRTRILGHFSGEHTDSKEQRLARQVRRIDWSETAGELGALLQEAEWIKAKKPLFNRRLKAGPETLTIRTPAGSDAGIELADVATVEAEGLSDCFGLFRSRKDALKALTDIARAQQLCLKALGLEESAGSCFAFQLGKCRGACVGKEPISLHRMRLQLALSSLKLKSWPFPGRIALREQDGRGRADLHVLEDWIYLGTAHSEEDLAELRQAALPRRFDADVYRILVRHFSDRSTASPGRRERLDWHDLRPAIRCA